MTASDSSGMLGKTATYRPARLTREQSRAQTRERLLASAAIVFTREGCADAAVDRIAKEAGYSKGALYSNFGSKDDLFLELVDHHAGGRVDELCKRLDAVQGADEMTWPASSSMRHNPFLCQLIATHRLKLICDCS
jgi:TetR/AcrR family transcriptional regulator, transcriptional repressor of aconitase